MVKVAIIGSQGAALVNFRRPLLEELIRRGHQVFAFAPTFSSADQQVLETIGSIPVPYAIDRNGINPLADLRTLVGLGNRLRELRCDVLLAFTIKPVIYGMIAGSAAGVRRRYALITGLGYALAEGAERNDTLKRRVLSAVSGYMYRVALMAARGVFFQNSDDAQFFVKNRIIPQSKILGVLPTGVNLSEWPPIAPPTDPLTFTLVARMLKDKGVREFAAAARTVKATHPKVRFVLLGGLDTNPNAMTPAEMQAIVSEGAVEWTGHTEVRPWLAKTSVFVLPSYHEGLPRSTQEAMATGRAVISTDAPGCRETVIEGVNGFLVPVRDSAALGVAVCRFINDTSLVSKMGSQSRFLAEQRFDSNLINTKILDAMAL